jgi:hypothetical protein
VLTSYGALAERLTSGVGEVVVATCCPGLEGAGGEFINKTVEFTVICLIFIVWIIANDRRSE